MTREESLRVLELTGSVSQQDVYSDDHVVYVGGDPRISHTSESAMLSADSSGLTLLDGRTSTPLIRYPVDSLLGIYYGHEQLVTKGPLPIDDFTYLSGIGPRVFVFVKDPEGLVATPFKVCIQLRNDYYAKLLLKRAETIMGLKRTQFSPDSMTVSGLTVVLALAAVFLLVALMYASVR